MLDVSQIMKELTTIVHEQGDTIGKTCGVLHMTKDNLYDQVLINGPY